MNPHELNQTFSDSINTMNDKINNQEDPLKEYMTTAQVANMLQRTVRTIHRWHANGTLVPDFIDENNKRYYKCSKVKDMRLHIANTKRGQHSTKIRKSLLKNNKLKREKTKLQKQIAKNPSNIPMHLRAFINADD